MDRRTFISTSTLATAGVLGVADRLDASGNLPQHPERELRSHLSGLETWAKEMGKQLDHAIKLGDGAILDRRVLPDIAVWFGKILGTMAAMKQV